MTIPTRPKDVAPGGMGGSGRMHDPSEAEHDRVRRRWMNIAFVLIGLLTTGQVWFIGVHGWDWLAVINLIAAGVPLGLTVKVVELRFKMARDERRRMLRGLPQRRQVELAIFACLLSIALWLNAHFVIWSLWGMWVYDFVTYYHDRPERMRHLYAVTKTFDELRDFPAPWAWVLPALVVGILRRL